MGKVTPETLLKSNTFIIWRGGAPKDFELKADYRITDAGNSGINYRSVVAERRAKARRQRGSLDARAGELLYL